MLSAIPTKAQYKGVDSATALLMIHGASVSGLPLAASIPDYDTFVLVCPRVRMTFSVMAGACLSYILETNKSVSRDPLTGWLVCS